MYIYTIVKLKSVDKSSEFYEFEKKNKKCPSAHRLLFVRNGNVNRASHVAIITQDSELTFLEFQVDLTLNLNPAGS